MANIGDQLTSPGSGMKRIDDAFYAFNYKNINMEAYTNKPTDTNNYYNKTLHFNWDNCKGYIEFYIYSKSLYILATNWINGSESTLYIDGKEIGTYGVTSCDKVVPQIIYHKIDNLEKKIHYCKLVINTNAYGFDCIDIDEDGYMIYCDDNGKLYYDMTPIMTSNTTPDGYIVSTDTTYNSNFSAYKAFDGNLLSDTGWCSAQGVETGYLDIEFPDITDITNIAISCGSNDTNTNNTWSDAMPVNFKLMGSNDGTTFVKLADFSDNDKYTARETRLYNIGYRSYRKYRLEMDTSYGNLGRIAIGELRYLLAVDTPFYLIKDNTDSKIYNYNEFDNQLTEVANISILKVESINNECIRDLNKVLPLLSNLSDDLTLLSNQDSNVLVNGIKSTKELIIGKNSFSTRIASNIDWFKLDDSANAKVVFSIDNGITWMTYNTDTSSFEEISVFITTNKNYQNFTEEAKTAWNEAKEKIYNEGIDSSILGTLDFNTLNVETIRFAYVLTAIDSNTIDKMKNLIWQFDSKGTMDLVDTSQVRQQLYYAGTKLISNIDADMLKVNITYEGINNNS